MTAAEEAAGAAEVEIREVDRVADLAEVEHLLGRVWGTPGPGLITVNLLKALGHSGHYVTAAWLGPEMVGASVAFWWGPDRPATLHSHITGVSPDAQGRGVGLALKLHQAAWTRQRGGRTITWTFDPMVRRNAWFNLMKLGVEVVSYHPDFYGQMDDGVNRGEPTDRVMAVWDVTEERPRPGRVGPDRATVLLRVGPDGRPVVEPVDALDGPGLCQVPEDAVARRRDQPGLGLEWAQALRLTLGRYLDSGHVAAAMTNDGFYVLGRK